MYQIEIIGLISAEVNSKSSFFKKSFLKKEEEEEVKVDQVYQICKSLKYNLVKFTSHVLLNWLNLFIVLWTKLT